MPSCSFYATPTDHVALVGAIIAEGYTVHPSYSRIDQGFGAYDSVADLLAATDLGRGSEQFVVYHPSMGGAIYRRRFELRPDVGAFRWESSGWGLISLVLRAPAREALGPSWAKHNSEKRAQKWEPTYLDQPDRVADWNWPSVTRSSNSLNRLIRRLSVDKSGSRWVLTGAAEAFAQGLLRMSLN